MSSDFERDEMATRPVASVEADMKAKHGQMPPFTATRRLKAAMAVEADNPEIFKVLVAFKDSVHSDGWSTVTFTQPAADADAAKKMAIRRLKNAKGSGVQYKVTRVSKAARASTTLTADMLMARTTQVSRIADKGMDQIVQMMRRMGYMAKTTQNKAFYTTVFTHEGEPEHTFEMVGWHGTGKFAGGEKTILEFYDDDRSKDKPVVAIGVINEDNINPKRQQEVVQDILEYVKHHG